jgi:uncharacterized protein (DUF1697 family)
MTQPVMSLVTRYVALLRAVNVGGTGKLPMTDLQAMAEAAGFTQVRTYIASGNLLFHSPLSEAEVKQRLEAQLAKYAGKPVPVFVRTAAEMAAIVAANPFPEVAGSRCLVIFLDSAPPADMLSTVTGIQNERIAPSRREIFIDYGDGMRDSKLKIPAAKAGTGRNINTVAKLAVMATA